MESRIYYGEYSLAYWLELMLTKRIRLPKYQRYFVWNEEKLKSLMESLAKNRFVPPVIIGFVKGEGGEEDVRYIIDGQQRLTCILLSYLNIFPDKEKYKARLENVINGTEELDGDEETNTYDDVLEWDYSKLTERGKTKTEICRGLEKNNYRNLGLSYDQDQAFWESHFLGFSYIVPNSSSHSDQQRYYTRVFRNINMQGVNLLPMESRRALYFINNTLEPYFEPEFISGYGIKYPFLAKPQMDFGRYLCLLSALLKQNNVNKVARGYSRGMEEYIEKYVYSVVEGVDEGLFGKFDDIFANKDYNADMDRLQQALELLELPKEYPSVIDMDMYFFGLIYYTLFKHKKIDIERKDELQEKIRLKIREFKSEKNNPHKYYPNQLRFTRKRITESIEIYKSYVL